jgi:chromate transporter
MNISEFVLLVFAYNAVAMGNGPAMLPFFQKDMVEGRGVPSPDQFLYAFTLAQVTPGQANLYVSSIGYMLYGMTGAILAALVIVLPGYLMLPLVRGYERFRHVQVIRRFSRGLTCGSVGLICAAAVEIARSSLRDPIGWLILALTLVLTQGLRWKPLPSLVTACCTGMLLQMWWGYF